MYRIVKQGSRDFKPSKNKGSFGSTRGFHNFQSDVVLVGAGPSTIRFLKQLGKKKFGGKVMVVSKDAGTPWMQNIFQEDPYFRLGQSKETLLEMPADQLYSPKERMPIRDFLRDQQNEAVQAVEPFEPEQLDYIEAEIVDVLKAGLDVWLQLSTGVVIKTRHAVFATGVGPERGLADAGVQLLNQPIGPRVVHDESTTAIKSFAKSRDFFTGLKVLVYGGSATSAWASENAALKGVDHLTWMSATGFKAANPNGNNNEIMTLTESLRTNGKIVSIEYQGDLASGSGIEVTVDSQDTNKRIKIVVDKIIAAIGSNPLGPTGIQRILGAQIYSQLQPLNIGTGFIAANQDKSIIVTIAPVSGDRRFEAEIEDALKQLPQDTRIAPSIGAVRASANAAVEVITGIAPEKESSDKEKVEKSTATKKQPSMDDID